MTNGRPASRRRSLRDWTDAARAQWAIARARVAIAMRPRGEVAATAFEGETATADPRDEPTVRRLALAVDRAARRGPIRANCLVRALALRSLLRAAGIRGARLHVGVRPDGTRLAAHAWISFGTLVVDDTSSRGLTFAELEPVGAREAGLR